MTAPVLIAGAGIGGLAAALALARRGIAVALFEEVQRPEETGAGIQLSPNATRILLALGLADRMASVPEAIRLRAARTGRTIATLPLGAAMTERYGAPYWVMHRADLRQALLDAVAHEARIERTFGVKVCDFALDGDGVVAKLAGGIDRRGTALICADGLWSQLRARLGERTPPRFAGRAAWRAMVPAARLPQAQTMPAVELWLGPGGHVVCYPVRAGAAVNIVAVAGDEPGRAAGSAAGRDAVLARFPAPAWAPAVREVLAAPELWQKWAIYDRAPSPRWGQGAATLLGDAAHPMLPFLAQGAAMAIEDAAVLAGAMERAPTDAVAALRAYEAARRPRTARVQRAARRNDLGYHLGAPAAFIRDTALRALGGERLLARFDWIYRWRPEAPQAVEGR